MDFTDKIQNRHDLDKSFEEILELTDPDGAENGVFLTVHCDIMFDKGVKKKSSHMVNAVSIIEESSNNVININNTSSEPSVKFNEINLSSHPSFPLDS